MPRWPAKTEEITKPIKRRARRSPDGNRKGILDSLEDLRDEAYKAMKAKEISPNAFMMLNEKINVVLKFANLGLH